MHRDLNPDNILVYDGDSLEVAITDLGLACSQRDLSMLALKCGTPAFIAPEVLNN